MTRSDHLFLKLMEECAEVTQRASKTLRFGLTETQPGYNQNNAERLIDEMIDLYTVWEMLREEHKEIGDIYVADITSRKIKIEKFLKYSKECGRLE